jgi:glycosyltransferase involved in cell wall biosynthesis
MAGGGGTERRFFRLFKFLESVPRSFQIIPVTTAGFLDDMRFLGLLGGAVSPVTLSEMQSSKLRSNNPAVFAFEANRVFVHQVAPMLGETPAILHAVFAYPFQLYWSSRFHLPLLYSLKSWPLALGRSSRVQKTYTRYFTSRSVYVDCPYPYVVDAFPGISKKLAVNFNVPIDCEKYQSSPLQKSPKILFVGRLIKEKGVELLLEALDRATEVLISKQWSVQILGIGPLEPMVEEFARRHPRLPVYVGQTLDPQPFYDSASVYLKLNTGENIPSQSLLEAMAAGCAVVATDVGNTRAWLSAKNALLVDANPDKVAKAIELLIIDNDRRMHLGLEAADWVRTHSSYPAYAAYYESLWRRTLSSAGG